jgi:ankyrin repeat protein
MNFENEKFIINNYLNIKSKDENGNTYLHFLVIRGDVNIIKYFLNNLFNNGKIKSIINETNNNHETALFIAVNKGYQDIAKELLNYGADKKIKNKDGVYVKFDYEMKGGGDINHIIYGSRKL